MINTYLWHFRSTGIVGPLHLHLPTTWVIWRISLCIVTLVTAAKNGTVFNHSSYNSLWKKEKTECWETELQPSWGRNQNTVSLCGLCGCSELCWSPGSHRHRSHPCFLSVWALLSCFSHEVVCKRGFFHWQWNELHKFFSPLKCHLLAAAAATWLRVQQHQLTSRDSFWKVFLLFLLSPVSWMYLILFYNCSSKFRELIPGAFWLFEQEKVGFLVSWWKDWIFQNFLYS